MNTTRGFCCGRSRWWRRASFREIFHGVFSDRHEGFLVLTDPIIARVLDPNTRVIPQPWLRCLLDHHSTLYWVALDPTRTHAITDFSLTA